MFVIAEKDHDAATQVWSRREAHTKWWLLYMMGSTLTDYIVYNI